MNPNLIPCNASPGHVIENPRHYARQAASAAKRSAAARLIRFDGQVMPLDDAVAACGMTRKAFLARYWKGHRTTAGMVGKLAVGRLVRSEGHP